MPKSKNKKKFITARIGSVNVGFKYLFARLELRYGAVVTINDADHLSDTLPMSDIDLRFQTPEKLTEFNNDLIELFKKFK